MINFSYTRRGGRATSIVFIVVGGSFVLLSLALLIGFGNDYSQLQQYQAGRCTITAKQLLEQEVTQTTTHTINGYTSMTTTTTLEYRPDFQFTVQTADGHSYPAQGYDTLNLASSDQTSQQAIVDQYTVGETYPCWYNPTNPSQAVLTRQFDWVVFLIPVTFFFVGGMFVILGILMMRSKINAWSQTHY